MQVRRLREDELYHHGIKGQRWGVRRYQNEDGSLTEAGRRRYAVGEKMDANDKRDSSITRKVKRDYNHMSDSEFKSKYKVGKNVYRHRVNKYGDPYMNSPMAKMGKKLAAKGKNKRLAKPASSNESMDDYALKELQSIKQYKKGDKLDIHKNDSAVTKRVKKDYNTLSDTEFIQKYAVKKDRYRKRVNKYGDPYENSPWSKAVRKAYGR